MASMSTPGRVVTSERKTSAIVFQTVFLDLLGFGLVLPLMPIYAEQFGATPLWVTTLSASYSLMQFIFVPLWGRLSDAIGRRPVMLGSIGAASVAYILMGTARSLEGLLIARILSGIAGANLSVAQAVIADTTRPEDRAKGMGMVGAAFGLGFILGPFIGGSLASVPLSWLPDSLVRWRSSFPFFAASLLALTNLLLASRWLPETRPVIAGGERTRTRPPLTISALARALRHPRVGWLLIMAFMTTLAFANMESTFVLWGEHTLQMTVRQAGYLFAYIGVIMTIVQGGLLGRLAKRFGEKRLILGGLVLMAASLLVTPLCRSYGPLLPVIAVMAIGSGLTGPSMQSLISRRSDAKDQGGILGISQSLSSLGRVLGPLWAGYAFGRFGPSTPWISGGLVMALTAGLAVIVLGAMRTGES